MKIVKPVIDEIIFHVPEGYDSVIQWLEKAGRVCYQSTPKGDAEKFIRNIVKRGHHSVIEHATASVIVSVDIGTTREWIRHRLSSFSESSTRYCNYSKNKFDNEITVVEYPWKKESSKYVQYEAAIAAEEYYMKLINNGEPAELARAVLPLSLKTQLVITANLRQWATIFSLRTDRAAHPIIRGIATDCLKAFNSRFEIIYGDQWAKTRTYVKCVFCGAEPDIDTLILEDNNLLCPSCKVDYRGAKYLE